MLTKLLSLLLIFLSLGQQTMDAYVAEMNLGGHLCLVNREYPLGPDYAPEDLRKVRVPATNTNVRLREVAAQAAEDMFKAAKEEEGYQLVAVSGYRSYGQQAAIFERKVKRTGSREKAMLLVAPPGTSEHQTGLVMDLGKKGNTRLEEDFGETDEGKWIADNCHRFGFIVRYGKEWTEVTGYSYEPWHLRYVGPDHAERIHALGIPLEYYNAQIWEAHFTEMEKEAAAH